MTWKSVYETIQRMNRSSMLPLGVIFKGQKMELLHYMCEATAEYSQNLTESFEFYFITPSISISKLKNSQGIFARLMGRG